MGVLQKYNVSYRYGNLYMEVFCYSDNKNVLSPTVSGLQNMFKKRKRYTDKYIIHFSTSKSQLLCLNTKTCTKSKYKSISAGWKCYTISRYMYPFRKYIIYVPVINMLSYTVI